jgi:hypothetical protein
MESKGNVCILGCHGAMDTDSLPMTLYADSAGLVYIKQKYNGPMREKRAVVSYIGCSLSLLLLYAVVTILLWNFHEMGPATLDSLPGFR